MTNIRTLGVVTVFSLAAHSVTAQQPNASAVAYGMAGNYIAAASGADAVAWNPAMLGINAPKFSLNLISASGSTGLDPVKLTDISAFYGKLIDANTKETWLKAIGSGKERGSLDLGVSLMSLSIWRVAVQGGISGSGLVNLNQDVAEAILYGNAGRTGTPKSLSFSGSTASGSMFATGAASIGIPLPLSITGATDEQVAVGVTGKIIKGIGVVRAQDNGSVITIDNVAANFPMIHTAKPDSPSDLLNKDAGSGMGVDVGLAWSAGGTTVSATARNVINTFKWSTTNLKATLGTASFDGTTNKASFSDTLYSLAPASMRTALEAEKFQPEIAGGIAHRSGSFLFTADASHRLGDATIDAGPQSHIGVGLGVNIIPLIDLRGGVAAVSEGYQAAGGVGLHLGPLEVGAAVSTRSRNSGSQAGAMISIVLVR
jgi:hypothetical protein